MMMVIMNMMRIVHVDLTMFTKQIQFGRKVTMYQGTPLCNDDNDDDYHDGIFCHT